MPLILSTVLGLVCVLVRNLLHIPVPLLQQVPPVYTAIAFDSGGVASGPMTSGFILPFAIGVCVAAQGESAVLRDAFGVVALVAMAPLITIQLLGFRAIVHNHIQEKRAMKRILDADNQQIINFM